MMKRPWDAIVWWEKRRLLYNGVLLVAGFLTIAIVEIIGSHFVQPGEDVEEPVFLVLGVIAYGFMANVFYTLGWVTELLWSGADTSRTEERRAKIFRFGLIFSTGLTLLPALIIPLLWLIFGSK